MASGAFELARTMLGSSMGMRSNDGLLLSPDWAWRDRLRLTAAILAVAAALVQAPSVARACTCPSGPGGALLWPPDGSTDVAVDTPIVVARFNYTDSEPDVEVSLSTESGTQVALNEVRKVPPSWKGCSSAELLYLRPANPLDAGGRYKVVIGAVDSDASSSPTFSVGSREFVPDLPIRPDVTYLAVYWDPGCVGASCPGVAELRIDIGAPGARPTWLLLRSDAAKGGRNHWPFRTESAVAGMTVEPETLHLAQRSVVLGSDECVDLQILGVDGQPLYESRRCNPDRCAVHDISGFSTCGDPPASGLDPLRVPAGSCDDPPVVKFDDRGLVEPEPEAMTPDGGSPDTSVPQTRERDAANAAPHDETDASPRASEPPGFSAGGCRASGSRSTSDSCLGLMLFSAWYGSERLRRARRRPSASHGLNRSEPEATHRRLPRWDRRRAPGLERGIPVAGSNVRETTWTPGDPSGRMSRARSFPAQEVCGGLR